MPNPNRRTSVVFPVILITLGAMFLYRTFRPDFNPWIVLREYWPLILIFIGLGKIWDYSRARQIDPRTGAPVGPGRAFSVGTTIAVLAFVVVVMIVLWHGGGSIGARNRNRFNSHEVHTVDAQGAKEVRATIQMGAGDLTIGGDTGHLLDGSFDFREGRDTPQVRYTVSGTVGELEVEESRDGPNVIFPGSDSHNDWNLRFGDKVPLEMEVNVGAGTGRLRLRDLPITRLELNIGAGHVDVDLTGDRKKDLDATISGGVGQATIRLPKNVGVIADVSGGLGSVDTHGLKKDGGEYTNDSYGHTPVTIHLHISGGIGSISLVQEP